MALDSPKMMRLLKNDAAPFSSGYTIMMRLQTAHYVSNDAVPSGSGSATLNGPMSVDVTLLHFRV
jgi:hypothetical protein